MRANARMIAGLLTGAVVAAGLAAAAFAEGYTVDTAVVAIGGAPKTVLTDPKGMTLYYFSADTPTKSACSGGCSSLWPALLSTAMPTSEDRLPGKLAVVRTANGAQVAYNGHLLYTYSRDTAKGDINGQGFAGKWWVATVDLKPAAAATPSGGYGQSGGGGEGGGMNGGY